MSQHIGPRTISATGGSIKRVGPYRIHTFPSELVTDGLVLNLDAGDPRSYPSSGTTWTDLSGNGNNGEIISCGYSNENGGRFDFVPTNNSRIAVDNFNDISSSYTVEIWFKSDEVVNYRNICDMNYGVHQLNTGPRLEQDSTGTLIWYTTASITGTNLNTINLSSTLVAGTIYHAVITYDSKNKTYSGYLNGNQSIANQTQLYGGDIPFDGIKLGVGYNNTRFFDGAIYSFKIYNRALSAAEVAQNYDALRVRYESYTNTFTPICAGGEGKVEVLCVAGGGGGGNGDNGNGGGGGGGAGGLIYNSAFSVNSNSAISLSIGQGGVYSAGYDNGDNTTFGSLTSVGGGSGNGGNVISGSNAREGGDGGSGGGGFRDGASGGDGTLGQGNNGGNAGSGSSLVGGGGGGGAGSIGQNGNGVIGGAGGSGLSYSISGESKYYAGGGGAGGHNTTGSPGGSGIGGDGGPSTVGLNAVPNTGSGGGGGRGATGISRIGGNGSNGTVIVRYPATDYNVEVLVVGGGGGGGYDTGGGGGAGGLVYNSKYSVSAGENIQVTVGKGGKAAANSTSYGTNGGSSKFHSVICIGGGAGGSNGGGKQPGLSGGSGGGGGAYSAVQGAGGTGVPGQGNDGGYAVVSAGGGGGGAGQSGFSADGTNNGDSASDGGDGLAYSITGSSVVYAAGGGGGQNSSDNRGTGGSSGVGGDGGSSTRNPTDPNANTGSGGGGGANTNQPNGIRKGTNGADGIVIIAYKGPQRGIGGTIDTTSRPGYTLHKFTTTGSDIFIP